MNGKLRILLLVPLFLFLRHANSQQFYMGGPHLTFTLPNPLWHEALVDSNLKIPMYRTVFKREAVEASNHVLVIPNIEIVVERTNANLDQFSGIKQRAIQIKIDSNLYEKNGVLQLKDAKAYFGHYISNNIHYKICIIQFINNGYGAQIIMDCTEDIFDEVWVEFRYFAESLKLEY